MPSQVKPLLLHTMDAPWRPNPLKAAILLESLRVPYEAKRWVSGSASNGVDGPVFVKINPNSRTPVLEDPNAGVLVWESGAVLHHLLRTYGTDSKFGPGPTAQDKADCDQWNQVLLATLAPAMGELAFFRKSENKEATSHFQDEIHRTLAVLNTHLGVKSPFFLGEHFTIVDMNFYPWLNISKLIGLNTEEYTHISRWLEECQSIPAIGAALKTIEKGKPAQE